MGFATQHNGGRIQIGTNGMQTGGEFPFLNCLKTAQQWSRFNDNTSPVDPLTSLLDSDGYPAAIVGDGISTVFFVPTQAARPGNYIATWDGTGTIILSTANIAVLGSCSFTGVIVGNQLTASSVTGTILKGQKLGGSGVTDYTIILDQVSGTTGGAGVYTVSKSQNLSSRSMTASGGSTTSSGGLKAGFYSFSCDGDRFSAGISAVGSSSNYIKNLQIFHVDDAVALLENGEVFGKRFMERLAEAKPGVIRFLGWQGANNVNTTSWWTRRPLNYVFYEGCELRQELFCGTTSSSGANYSASAPAVNSMTGAAWSGLVHGATVQYINGKSANANITAAVSSGSNTVLSIATTSVDAVFNSVGEQILVDGVEGPWGSINGTRTVVAASSGSVTINFNSSALTPGAIAGTAKLYHLTCTLNVGVTGAKNILSEYAGILSVLGNSYPVAGNIQSLATAIYDATLDAWVKQGGDVALNSMGLNNGCPHELMLRLCAEAGAHPHFVTPIMATDPATDYMPNLAAYCRDNGPSWMIPRFEGPNELWNTQGGFFQTGYGMAKQAAYAAADPTHWTTTDAYHSWYGKMLSVLGQAVALVYGVAQTDVKTQTKYHVLCGVQTGHGISASDSNERLASTSYVNQTAAAQSPYLKQAANLWATGPAVANYYSPTDRFSVQEPVKAYAYSVADPTQKTVIANSYVDTSHGSAAPYNLAFCKANYEGWKAWAISFGLSYMTCYEGAYSPDYLTGDWYTYISDISKGNPCIVTLQTTSGTGNSETDGPHIAGNPAAVGMTFNLHGTGISQLEGTTQTVAGVGVAAGLAANQISLLNVDGTLFATYTPGGFGYWVGSRDRSNALRGAGRRAPNTYDISLQSYNDFVGLTEPGFTSEFPCQFLMAGGLPSASVWPAMEDIYETPNTAAWNAVVAFSAALPPPTYARSLRLRW